MLRDDLCGGVDGKRLGKILNLCEFRFKELWLRSLYAAAVVAHKRSCERATNDHANGTFFCHKPLSLGSRHKKMLHGLMPAPLSQAT